MIKTRNCAIFGGTFDPFHNGHLHLIDRVIELNLFDRLIIVPSGDPWQRQTVASARERLEMTQLALESRTVIVSECEVARAGSSYAIDTLTELALTYPSDNYSWILGSDAFAGIATWHRFQELAELIDFVVISRPGKDGTVAPQGVRASYLDLAALDISATQIRKKISNREDISNLVPKPVADYIKRRGLYGAP